jgi:hypothetical protein
VGPLAPNIFSVLLDEDSEGELLFSNYSNSVLVYTTAVVNDSENQQASPVILQEQAPSVIKNIKQLNMTVTQMQFLQCSKSVVQQTGALQSQSNTLNGSSIYPGIYKTSSRWTAAADLDLLPQDSTLLGSSLVLSSFLTS